MNIFEELVKADKSLKAYALITVVSSESIGTANPGKKMILYKDGSHVGTIGGGAFEYEFLKLASENLDKNIKLEIKEFKGVKLLVECFSPATTLVVIGGGHVGNALLRTAKLLPFTTILVDDRENSALGDSVELADRFIRCTDYEQSILSDEIPEGAYFFSGAWNHKLDASAVKGALQKKAAYIGMVGSHEKARNVFEILKQQGVSEDEFKQVFTPVGLDIADGTPDEIAFSIMAEILMIKNGGDGSNCKTVKTKFLSSSCDF